VGYRVKSVVATRFRIWATQRLREYIVKGFVLDDERLKNPDQPFDYFAEMQRIIDAEQSDIFDVLAHVAYAVPPVTREVRAANARIYINAHFSAKQQAFLDFVLQHYVQVGVEELDQEKLTPLLRLQYHDSIADAIADLGRPEEIGAIFAGFQSSLYQEAVA
ncbi:MAG: virulence RhuM family protein, partial [Nitrospirae bacterium]|nr:virulence RhuM family protein [Nitrospirota bacterium]